MIKKILLPILILAFFSAVAVAMYWSRPEPEKIAPELPSFFVEVAEAKKTIVNFEVKSQGSVSPRTETTLIAEASGQIIEVSEAFVGGGFFAKGQVLIRIDPRNYASDVKRAKANVAKAATQLATESALAGYARDDWKRLRDLDPEVAPASDLTLRKPQLQEAIATLQSAEADLEKAEGDLDRTVIRAPYNGMVRQKIADVGQYVNTGSQLAVTFAVDKAEVRLPVTQQDLQFLDIGKLRSGEPIPVILKADLGGGSFTWRASVTRTGGVFDPQSRVLYLVAEVLDPYDLAGNDQIPLLMGTFVSAEIEGRPGGELFLIPRYSMPRGNTLWLVDEESRIYPQEVSVVRRDDDYVYVSEGIEGGDQYCLTPIAQPLPGMKVRFSG
ncbi:efflux RND transporter periplasmic adaptor subunit [Gammaproteobacteria bacterium]|nr:efflux RND transporter periplasmic adaptor subunit [Gammaproteobacteria bacterium]